MANDQDANEDEGDCCDDEAENDTSWKRVVCSGNGEVGLDSSCYSANGWYDDGAIDSGECFSEVGWVRSQVGGTSLSDSGRRRGDGCLELHLQIGAASGS